MDRPDDAQPISMSKVHGPATDEPDSPSTFSADFRAELQQRKVTLRQAEASSGWGKSTIAAATHTSTLSNLNLILDVLTAIGVSDADMQNWRERHRRLQDSPPPEPDSVSAPAAPPPAPPVQRAGRASVRLPQRATAIMGGVLLIIAAATTVWILARPAATPLAARPGSRTIVVQNQVAFDSSSLTEDRSPSYLATRPVARCANQPGCKIEGTDLATGDTVTAVCQLQGALLTNADVHSTGVESNPNVAASALWYGIDRPDGRLGFISEVYIAPTYRGGLGLPLC